MRFLEAVELSWSAVDVGFGAADVSLLSGVTARGYSKSFSV